MKQQFDKGKLWGVIRLLVVGAIVGYPVAGWSLPPYHLRVPEASTAEVETPQPPVAPEPEEQGTPKVIIERLEKVKSDEPASAKETAWLGVTPTEASEALAAQLELSPGVGLLVSYVAPESPAAKAGLVKNDVLTRFNDQSLVHPAQLRKLVRVRKPGDMVHLSFYRSGKEQTVSVTLGKAPGGFAGLEDGEGLRANLHVLRDQMQDLKIDDAVRDQYKALRNSLGDGRIDNKKVQIEIHRSIEQVQKAIQEAVRNITNGAASLGPMRKALENLAHSGVTVENNATVTVSSSGKGAKSLVNTDDNGTIILFNHPKLHLTAHGKDGELTFDGDIETQKQRDQVPRALWKQVQPLLEKMGNDSPDDVSK